MTPNEIALLNLPTDARPGSDDKIRVLIARYQLRRPLFHPQDGHAGGTQTRRLTAAALADREYITELAGRQRWQVRVYDPASRRQVSVGVFRSLDTAIEARNAFFARPA